MRNSKNQEGYTLVELLVVIVAAASLIAMTIIIVFNRDLLPSMNPSEISTGAGFFKGVFHGSFSSLFLFASLFTNIGIYEVHNNGFWYNFGYLLPYIYLGSSSIKGKK